MPPKSNQITLIRRMDERIAALEGEMAGVKASLSSLEQGQATLIAMFEKSLGKGKEGGVIVNGETPETESEARANGRNSKCKLLNEEEKKGEARAHTKNRVFWELLCAPSIIAGAPNKQ